MINLCFDKLLEDPSSNFLEEDWIFVYNKHRNNEWPELQSFEEFKKCTKEFQKSCQYKKIDPESHKKRIGYRRIPYPNCTDHIGKINENSWGEFSNVFPNTEYFRLVDYLHDHDIDYKIWQTVDAPNESFYCIGINTYHLDFDYFSKISQNALKRLKKNEINLLFFYHEGDNPYNIKKHLILLCEKHNVDINRIYFVSGNSEADNIENFYYFFDDEILFQGSQNETISYHDNPRSKKFTALVRIEKLWRAIFMSELWKRGLHNQGYFSYNQIVQDNKFHEITAQPFDREFIESKYRNIQNFLAAGPFKADRLDDIDHNSFENLHKEHYENSYCNFAIETHFELEDKCGTSLTEKILKPICHNQFFIVVGPPHTLKKLKELGYKTFNRLIDESYDTIEDSEKRLETVIELCTKIATMNHKELHELYTNLKPEIIHNSNFFNKSKKERLENLINNIKYEH